jgi:antitoxin StbD
MGTVAAGGGLSVAILNRNEPAFYCAPAKAYEALMNRLDDLESLALCKERENDPTIKVSIDDLWAGVFWKSLERMEKAWRKSEGSVQKEASRAPFKPHVLADLLIGLGNDYKIKLRSAWYRMVYRVKDEVLVVTVIAVGKKDRGEVYKDAATRWMLGHAHFRIAIF